VQHDTGGSLAAYAGSARGELEDRCPEFPLLVQRCSGSSVRTPGSSMGGACGGGTWQRCSGWTGNVCESSHTGATTWPPRCCAAF